MDKQATVDLNEIAPAAIVKLKEYFNDAGDDTVKKADMALKVLGRINGNDTNRLKSLTLQFKIACMMGLKGPDLRPLLAELAGPDMTETAALASGGEVKEGGGSLAEG